MKIQQVEATPVPQPNGFQNMMLAAPMGEHLFCGTGKGLGKSMGIKFTVARDAQVLKDKYACLILRSSFQALQEIQADLFKYLSLVFPGTRYNSQEQIFYIGGKGGPYGTVELAYSASSPMEQARALTRLQGRSKSCIIADEAGAVAGILDFLDELSGVLRGDPAVPRRMIILANPGGPAHSSLKERFVDPLPEPLEHMKPQRFWSEHYQRHCISLSANASINPHIDWELYKREIELMSHGDPELLDALLLGKWGDMGGGSAFGAVWSPRRCRFDLDAVEAKALVREHMPRPFVAMDHGISAPSVAYLLVPDPPGIDAPKGTIWIADELYICSRGRAGREWHKGAMLGNHEQAELIRDWLERWNFKPDELKLLADDAVFSRNGSPNGSVAGDFRQAGVRLTPADKANTREVDGLNLLKSRMAASRKDDAPWLLWSGRCSGWEATVPSLARDPVRHELIASGQPNHALDAVRYGVAWFQGRTLGPRQSNWRMW